MERRILNAEALVSTGNVAGRKAVVEILEAGFQASDPYPNTRKLVRREGNRLIVGCKEFEPAGSPRTGEDVYDLSKIGRIFVFGAGKGIQRVAKAIEDTLGDRLTGGHVIDKKGHPVELKRIEVTLGGHPAPDEDCAIGCRRILEMSKGLTSNDLVFTCAANGISSLLTLPAPGLTSDELRKVTVVTQIERGMPTGDLGPIRNHIDAMKGGRISRHLHPAKMVHILAIDPGDYDQLMHRNSWLHTLPDCTTFQDAVNNLHRFNAWDAVPEAVRRHLLRADPAQETVKADEFKHMDFRIFGVMPGYRQTGKVYAAMKKAAELGFTPHFMAEELMAIEASQAGLYLAAIAKTIERTGQPFEPPCAIFSSGEVVVTVGDSDGIGGRNQEVCLSAAQRIAGSKNIVIGSVDTDGTDGPGDQFASGGGIPCLAGGVVDGTTVAAAKAAGIDIEKEIKRHNTSPPLWKLNSGVHARPNISLIDLTVAVILGRSESEGKG